MKKCIFCEKTIDDDAVFCPYCGGRIDSDVKKKPVNRTLLVSIVSVIFVGIITVGILLMVKNNKIENNKIGNVEESTYIEGEAQEDIDLKGTNSTSQNFDETLNTTSQSNSENCIDDEDALFYVKCRENSNKSLGIKEIEGYKYFIDEYGTQKYSKDGNEVIFNLHLTSEMSDIVLEYNEDWGHFYPTNHVILNNSEGDSVDCIEYVCDFPDGNTSKSFELYKKIDNDYTLEVGILGEGYPGIVSGKIED